MNEPANALTILKGRNQKQEDMEDIMCRTVSFKVSRGMDSAVRVLTTLRRKQFDVREFSMVSDDENMVFKITLEDEKRNSFNRAILQMQKLVDVYDVLEV